MNCFRNILAITLAPKYVVIKLRFWRRQRHPTPVLLPGKFYGWRSLVGYSPWSCKESDMTERLHFPFPSTPCSWHFKDSSNVSHWASIARCFLPLAIGITLYDLLVLDVPSQHWKQEWDQQTTCSTDTFKRWRQEMRSALMFVEGLLSAKHFTYLSS